MQDETVACPAAHGDGVQVHRLSGPLLSRQQVVPLREGQAAIAPVPSSTEGWQTHSPIVALSRQPNCVHEQSGGPRLQHRIVSATGLPVDNESAEHWSSPPSELVVQMHPAAMREHRRSGLSMAPASGGKGGPASLPA
jgi:hypothetical protein